MTNALARLSEENQKEFWASLALKYCPKMTQRLLRSLLYSFGSAYKVFKNATETLSSHTKKITPELRSSLKSEAWRENALLEWREAKAFRGEIILWTDYRYPLELKQLIDAPIVLYCKGDLSLLASPSVAIIGSRKFHPQTLKKAREIAEDLSQCGICVVSGMARGIDSAAHEGALNGIGKTIAVLGCGADIIYPKENKVLYEKIIQNGLLLSEFSPRTEPTAQNFPIRNRIVSGLCAAVLVAEAELRSGSLITARMALEQNRHVYALKPIHASHSIGVQNLIQDGAVEIEDAMTILAEIAPNLENRIQQREEQINVLKILEKQVKAEYQEEFDKRELKKLDLGEDSSQNEKTNNTKNVTVIRKRTNRTSKENEIYTRDSYKSLPSKNANITQINIDFQVLTQELMGNLEPVTVAQILEPNKQKRVSSKSREEKSAQKKHVVDIIHTSPIREKKEDIGQRKENLIAEENNQAQVKEEKDTNHLDIYQQNILKVLEKESPLTPDDLLLHLTGTFISQLSTALLMLEVEGFVERLSGNRYRLAY